MVSAAEKRERARTSAHRDGVDGALDLEVVELVQATAANHSCGRRRRRGRAKHVSQGNEGKCNKTATAARGQLGCGLQGRVDPWLADTHQQGAGSPWRCRGARESSWQQASSTECAHESGQRVSRTSASCVCRASTCQRFSPSPSTHARSRFFRARLSSPKPKTDRGSPDGVLAGAGAFTAHVCLQRRCAILRLTGHHLSDAAKRGNAFLSQAHTAHMTSSRRLYSLGTLHTFARLHRSRSRDLAAQSSQVTLLVSRVTAAVTFRAVSASPGLAGAGSPFWSVIDALLSQRDRSAVEYGTLVWRLRRRTLSQRELARVRRLAEESRANCSAAASARIR